MAAERRDYFGLSVGRWVVGITVELTGAALLLASFLGLRTSRPPLFLLPMSGLLSYLRGPSFEAPTADGTPVSGIRPRRRATVEVNARPNWPLMKAGCDADVGP